MDAASDSVGHHVTNVKNASGDMPDDAGDAVTAAAGYARDTAKHGVQKVKNASGDMLNDAKDANSPAQRARGVLRSPVTG